MKKVLTAIMSLVIIITGTITAIAAGNRRITGEGKALYFAKGESVCGAQIEINSRIFENCYIINAPMSGYVASGVINPWKGEFKGKRITNEMILGKITRTRKTSGEGKTITFKKGDFVCGSVIKINGKTYFNSYIHNAPQSGTITSGVVNYWRGENKGLTFVTTAQILATRTRIPTGSGQWKNFQAGDNAVGIKMIFDNGKTADNGSFGVVVYNSPIGGKVFEGVVNPWSTEIKNQKIITP